MDVKLPSLLCIKRIWENVAYPGIEEFPTLVSPGPGQAPYGEAGRC